MSGVKLEDLSSVFAIDAEAELIKILSSEIDKAIIEELSNLWGEKLSPEAEFEKFYDGQEEGD